jgi:hypothetical protein
MYILFFFYGEGSPGFFMRSDATQIQRHLNRIFLEILNYITWLIDILSRRSICYQACNDVHPRKCPEGLVAPPASAFLQGQWFEAEHCVHHPPSTRPHVTKNALGSQAQNLKRLLFSARSRVTLWNPHPDTPSRWFARLVSPWQQRDS